MRDRDRLSIFYPITNQLRVWDTDVHHCSGMKLLVVATDVPPSPNGPSQVGTDCMQADTLRTFHWMAEP